MWACAQKYVEAEMVDRITTLFRAKDSFVQR